ncbi:MAG: hypothetical protein ACLRZG_01675 [Streptococcus sp.]
MTRAQETVTIAGNKVKDAESVNKAAQDELTRAKEFDASRQAKINETKSTLDKERTEKNIPALEDSLASAKANVEAKEKALAETKLKQVSLKLKLMLLKKHSMLQMRLIKKSC